jgi:transcription elongation factor Elf1
MELKICLCCKEEKSIDDFSKSKNKYREKCKICLKEYMKKHYENNKKTYIDYAGKRRVKIRKWFKNYKSTLKCKICGENHISVLDFHHEDPKIKDKHVSSLLGYSENKLKEEIEKCIVLCSNCHRKLHYNEKMPIVHGEQ